MKMKLTGFRDLLLHVALQPKNLGKALNRWMPAVSSQALTVMTLDGQWLKLLRVEGPPPARCITRLLAFPVEGNDQEQLEKTLKEACAAEGFLPSEVLVANPTHLCTVRLFSLPSTDQKEIRDIVELQAEKHTPYAKEEILTDFNVIDRDRPGYSRVMLVIVHQDVVHRTVRLVESSGLTLDRVGCELEGLINWFLLVKRGAKAAASAASSLVVDVDGSTTTLLVMQRGQLHFHRSLATGAEQLQEDPTLASERLVSEIQRSIEAIEAEAGSVKPQEVVLTGRLERLGKFKGLIEQALNLPVSLVSPTEAQAMSEGARVAAERLPDVSFASLIGLAFSPSSIDLTPQATKLRHAFEAKAKALVLLGCQGIGALILVSVLIIGRAQKEYRYDQTLRTVYKERAQEAASVEEALRQMEFVKGRLRQRGQLLEAAETLAKLTPPDIRWESMSFTNGEAMVLKGTSSELPKVYEFVASLDSSPLFEHVEAKRVTKRKSGEESLTDFEITCPLASAKTVP